MSCGSPEVRPSRCRWPRAGGWALRRRCPEAPAPCSAALPPPFTVPLPVPPVLRPARSDATMDYYEITAKPGQAEILPGRATEIWGYNGIFPGQTLETRSGRMVVVRHRNELPVPVVAHLHGGKTPPQHDGYPTDLILPGGGWDGENDGHMGDHGSTHTGMGTDRGST